MIWCYKSTLFMGFNKKNSGDDYQIEVDESEAGNFEEMLQASFTQKEKKLSVGDKVKAEVLSVGKENIVVSTGGRSDSVLSLADFEDEKGKSSLKVGDKIDLYVVQISGGDVQLSPFFTQNSYGSKYSKNKHSSHSNNSQASTSMKEQLRVGMQTKGKVTRLEAFGAFIEIVPGVEGLAHISELSWARVKNPNDILKVGDIVNAEILSIEPGERKTKIALTLKQASQNPWQNLPAHILAGRVVSGKVTRTAPFGAFVELTAGVEGLIPLSEMSSIKRVARAEEVVSVGQEVSVLVKDLNTQTKRISLSLKAATDAAASASESQDIQDYSTLQKNRESKQSEGDFASKIKAALDKKNQK